MGDNVYRFIVTILVILGFFGFIFLLMVHPLPDTLRDLMSQVQAGMFALVTLAVGYWLGSSAGSARKDATIAQLHTPDPGPQPILPQK